MSVRPQPGILDIALYEGGQAHVEGVADVVKLSSNENPFGPSLAAQEAFRRIAGQLHRYPPTDHADLRAAIAAVHGLDADRVICGAGSDEIITFLCQAYAGPGDEVVYTEHGFSMYRISALAAGATPVEVPERARTVDVDAVLAGVTERTRLVFIANPANPTGTMLPEDDISRLADGLPESALLVLDGAYAEYVEGFDGGAAQVEARNSVVMTRTFSKIYGLGGLRVGWGYGAQEVIGVLNRVRGPFNLGQPALETARAALLDRGYVTYCQSENARLRAWLTEALTDLGVGVDPSSTNFILARFDNPAEADACDAYLKSQGLIVRKVAGYKLPEALRITVGDESACRRVVHAIRQFREGQA
ncbi:histidinol phosphate aminotransferase [Rhodovulum imhoffii]|uniref:Histidinol-phosphate aminotransferase n=1 Tax=Rhodovulum imhoffii TaxID=365340 RepID=A0A2T5BV37_9RHOB|nr:histidinol-phosphate transaminase [Rhodovulum imhoffii]MBK5934637.1 histidinol-phosphate transaminase [Rhodovulum imhoffii]PTN03389.1 histidinol phosphate aminotransferase [Rhodovulum imhoffii]